MSILFKNASVLMPDFEVVDDCYVGVAGSTIIYVGKSKPSISYDEVRDFRNKLLMPGLINTHTHAAMTLLRGLGCDFPLKNWLFDCILPKEDNLTRDDIRVGTDLAIMEMLSTGTTSFSDMYFYSEDTIRSVISSGMKANVSRSVVSVEGQETWQDSHRMDEAKAIYSLYHNEGDGRIKVDFSLHAEYTGTNSLAEHIGMICKEKGLVFHCHVSETWDEHIQCMIRHEGLTPVQWLNRLGCLESTSLLAHCVFVTDEDTDILMDKNAFIAHCPSSNLKLGSGLLPMIKLQEKNCKLTLGTDGAASNNNLNMFEELHLASLIHKGVTHDPTLFSINNALQAVTIDGAHAQGRKDTGAIREGFKADIIAIDLDKPHLIPNIDSKSLLCYSVQGSDVCMTMVDGKILYENGEYKTIDKEKVFHEVNKVKNRLYYGIST